MVNSTITTMSMPTITTVTSSQAGDMLTGIVAGMMGMPSWNSMPTSPPANPTSWSFFLRRAAGRDSVQQLAHESSIAAAKAARNAPPPPPVKAPSPVPKVKPTTTAAAANPADLRAAGRAALLKAMVAMGGKAKVGGAIVTTDGFTLAKSGACIAASKQRSNALNNYTMPVSCAASTVVSKRRLGEVALPGSLKAARAARKLAVAPTGTYFKLAPNYSTNCGAACNAPSGVLVAVMTFNHYDRFKVGSAAAGCAGREVALCFFVHARHMLGCALTCVIACNALPPLDTRH